MYLTVFIQPTRHIHRRLKRGPSLPGYRYRMPLCRAGRELVPLEYSQVGFGSDAQGQNRPGVDTYTGVCSNGWQARGTAVKPFLCVTWTFRLSAPHSTSIDNSGKLPAVQQVLPDNASSPFTLHFRVVHYTSVWFRSLYSLLCGRSKVLPMLLGYLGRVGVSSQTNLIPSLSTSVSVSCIL